MLVWFEFYGIVLFGLIYKVGLLLMLVGELFDYVYVNMMQGEYKQFLYLFRQCYGQVFLFIDCNNGCYFCQFVVIMEYFVDMIGKFGGGNFDECLQVCEWMYWDFDWFVLNVYCVRGIWFGIWLVVLEVFEFSMVGGYVVLKVFDEYFVGCQWIVGEGMIIVDIDIYGVIVFVDDGGFDFVVYFNIQVWVKWFEVLFGFKSWKDLLLMEFCEVV